MVRFDGALLCEKRLKVVEYNFTSELSSVNLSTVYFVLYAMKGIQEHFLRTFVDSPAIRVVKSERTYNEHKKSSYL